MNFQQKGVSYKQIQKQLNRRRGLTATPPRNPPVVKFASQGDAHVRCLNKIPVLSFDDACSLRYEVWQTECFVILDHSLPFYPINNLKNRNFEKQKKIMEISSSRAIFSCNLFNILEDWGQVPGPFPFRNLPQLLNNQLFQDSSVAFF